MPLRFTIRDLLWLTLVVAIIAGIWRESATRYRKWAEFKARFINQRDVGLTMAATFRKAINHQNDPPWSNSLRTVNPPKCLAAILACSSGVNWRKAIDATILWPASDQPKTTEHADAKRAAASTMLRMGSPVG